MHDGSVNRTTNGKGDVAQMMFDDIRTLDAGGGANVPTFDERLTTRAARSTSTWM